MKKFNLIKYFKNSVTLLADPKKALKFLKYLSSPRINSLRTARLVPDCKICCTSFSEYLSVLNLQPNQAELEFMRARLNGARVAFDVGANVGSWSVLMHKLNPTCQIFSFEPIAKVFELLKINASFNSGGKITPIHAAVSDSDGEMEFQVPGNVAIFGRLAPKKPVSFLDARFLGATVSKVPTIRLEKFCAARNITFIDFLKIDVEGFELQALQGFGNLMKQKRIGAMHVETIRENHERAGESFDEFVSFVGACGYSFYLLGDGGLISQKIPRDKILHHNHVCLPD